MCNYFETCTSGLEMKPVQTCKYTFQNNPVYNKYHIPDRMRAPTALFRSTICPLPGSELGLHGSTVAPFAPTQHILRTPALRGITELAVYNAHLAVSLNTTFGKFHLPQAMSTL